MTTADAAFPRLHGRPESGWVNDPNGCSFVDGRYHVFFQHNPDSPTHDAIKWGHASSEDLISWRQEPIALTNRPDKIDAYGCWTGCVVDDHGVPTAVYSAVADGLGRAEVVLARSDRSLEVWDQDETSVVAMPADRALTDVRDPFVFSFDGHRYAIQGAGHKEGSPQILLYRCDDLTQWTQLGPLLTHDDPIAATIAPANIWECPNLALIDGRWVLVVSLWKQVDGRHVLDGVRYLVGDLVASGDGLRFVPTTGGELDTGGTFYAPQLLVQAHRVLLWGWAWEDGRSAEEIEAAGWAGCLTFPRELRVIDGEVVSRPAPELAGLRGERLSATAEVSASSFEIESGGAPVTLSLATGDGTRTVCSLAGPGRILVDGSIIEVFGAGSLPITCRAYPDPDSHWQVSSQWELQDIDDSVTVWQLCLP